MFNPSYFKTFIALVETGSFTGTAAKLDMTQPSVSQHLRKLEEYFSLPLLVRKGKSFELSPAGKQVYDYALQMFASHETFRLGLEEELLEGGECRISCVEVLGVLFYPFALSFMKKHPRLRLHLNFAENTEAIADVLAGKSRLALVSDIKRNPDLSYTEYLSEPLVVITPADFQGDSLQDLLSLGFISYAQAEQKVGELLKANFPDEYRSSRQLIVKSYVNRVNLALDAVARGLGFSVVPRIVWEASHWQQQLLEWHLPVEVQWTIYQVSLKERPPSKRYVQLLDEYLAWRKASSH